MSTTTETVQHTPTLTSDGSTGDGKRAFYVAKENDGWHDLRIEVDTDDCDGEFAVAAMQRVVRACNNHEALVKQLQASNDMLAMVAELLADGPHHAKAQFVFEQRAINAAAIATAAK